MLLWALPHLVRCSLVCIDSHNRDRGRWRVVRVVLRGGEILRGGDCCRCIGEVLQVVVLMMVCGDNCIVVLVEAGWAPDLTDLLSEDVDWTGCDRKLIG